MESTLHKPNNQWEETQDWMSRLPDKLWDVPLYNLSIPGSHDTMTYCLDKRSPVDPQSPKLLQILDQYVPCIARAIILKWSTTQELNIREQLDAGVRYLDLRIAHRPGDSSPALYFVHGLFTSVTVEATLKEILNWLQAYPKEVLILACRHLQEMTPELHRHLISCIERIFSLKLCPRHENPTLRNMWKQGYQVIISYEDIMAIKYECLWPAIPYWWADTTSTHALIHYLEKNKQKGRPGGFFVAGLNLTENLAYILKHPMGSMRKMTLPKLPLLYQWVKKQHPGARRDSINIITEDLIGSDCFISAVISLNRKLLFNHKS
ncbi:PI-PLC X domain-containing protein 1 isoform X2 [Ascaphus truei]